MNDQFKIPEKCSERIRDIYEEEQAFRLAMEHFAKLRMLNNQKLWEAIKEAIPSIDLKSDTWRYDYDTNTITREE